MFNNAKKGDIAVMVDTDFSAHGDKDQLEIVLVDEEGIYVYDPNDRLLFEHASGVEYSFCIDFNGKLAGREPAIKEILPQ